MESHVNGKINFGSPEGFPLIGGSKAAQAGYPPPQASYRPPQAGYLPPQAGYIAPQGDYFSSTGNPSAGPPITTQPASQQDGPNSGWMSIPPAVLNCPPGLEYLSMIDQLIVHRQPNLKTTMSGGVSKSKYVITNIRGEIVYYGQEVSECCARNWCGSIRGFEMKIIDNFGNEVISMNRPLACQQCCCPCCLQSIGITAPPGTTAGVIEQQWSIFYPTFVVKNSGGNVVLRIRGPFCGSACSADVNFMILSADGDAELGKVYKKFLGRGNQMYTDENVFGVEFPMDLDVKMKATMLGACFLIEMMYFEISGILRNDPHVPAVLYNH